MSTRKVRKKAIHENLSTFYSFLVLDVLGSLLDNFSTKTQVHSFLYVLLIFLTISLTSLFLLTTFDVCFVISFLTTCPDSHAGNKSLLKKLPMISSSFGSMQRSTTISV